MKKILLILVPILFVFVVNGCNGATTQKEDNTIINDNEIAVDPEGTIDDINYDIISAYMEKECKSVFSSYYELLDFEISDYQEEFVNGNVEAIFSYKLIYKNYDKDPDTVGYIKEAKERGDRNYQQLYDEYLQS